MPREMSMPASIVDLNPNASESMPPVNFADRI